MRSWITNVLRYVNDQTGVVNMLKRVKDQTGTACSEAVKRNGYRFAPIAAPRTKSVPTHLARPKIAHHQAAIHNGGD